VIMTS